MSSSRTKQEETQADPAGTVLNVTDVSQYVFCPRQFYLAKVLGLRRQPPEFVEGSLEHDARRLLNEALCHAYSDTGPDPERLMTVARMIIDKVLGYAKKVALLQHPTFAREIESFVTELSFRLQLEEDDRTRTLATDSMDSLWPDRVLRAFPIECEKTVFSPSLGLRGRIDEVYLTKDETLVIRDIKTAPACFPFDEANKIQLGAYAMLLEGQESTLVVSGSIYSSRSLAERQVVIGHELKKKVLDAQESVRRFLANPRAPAILRGVEAVKCGFCFLRDECQSFRDSESSSTGIDALLKSHGKLTLFGDN